MQGVGEPSENMAAQRVYVGGVGGEGWRFWLSMSPGYLPLVPELITGYKMQGVLGLGET